MSKAQASPPSEGPINPARVHLPLSPQESDLEALVELLATDEPIGARSQQADTGEQANLRDADGNLDFAKIRNMFSSDRTKPPMSTSREGNGNDEDLAKQTSQADDWRVSAQIIGKSSNRDMTLDSDTTGIFDAGISANAVQSTPPMAIHQIRQEDGDLIDFSSDLPPWNQGFQSVKLQRSTGLSPTQSSKNDSNSSSSFSAVKNALDMAQREVESLRAQCQKLEERVQRPQHQDEIAPTGSEEPNHQAFSVPFSPERIPHKSESETNPQEDSTGFDDQPHFQALDVNHLSLSQARFALQLLLDELGLPTSCLRQLLNDSGHKRETIPSLSLDEIRRAIEMTMFLDELVWRRSCLGAADDNPYSAENIQALRERLQLWERAVRTRK